MTTLADTGQILVTARACREYVRAVERPGDSQPREIGQEEARRELTTLLTAARRIRDADDGAEQWRIRSRGQRLDITAHVSREGALAVVTHVHVRDYAPRSRRA